MADNMCGPSNGAKNLVNYAGQDRSLQQDRMVNANIGAGSVSLHFHIACASSSNC
jgi:hypothetical protein